MRLTALINVKFVNTDRQRCYCWNIVTCTCTFNFNTTATKLEK